MPIAVLKDGVVSFHADLTPEIEKAGLKWRRVKKPGITALRRMVADSVVPAVDGCKVEPDGHCIHGWPSWLLALNMI